MADLKLVLVRWGDAHSRSTWLETSEALEEHKPAICFSVGWKLKDDKEGVTLYATFADDSTVSETLFIPRGMVQKVVELKYPRVVK